MLKKNHLVIEINICEKENVIKYNIPSVFHILVDFIFFTAVKKSVSLLQTSPQTLTFYL